jgi:UTP--glucose-1-phosphate uridylyltransferase
MKVRKAVIPAAGLGTRFLPATKAVPKEMLPIYDRPTIEYIVEEAVKSGIEQILIILGRNKNSIEDHFDKSYELEKILEEKEKIELLEKVNKVSSMAEIHFMRQKEALGLGHAVLCAKNYIGDEPFAILLGDDIVDSRKPCLLQLIESFNKHHKSILGVQKVDDKDVNKYGILDGNQIDENTWKVNSLIEKPEINVAPSNIAILGRYILTPKIFDFIEETKPGKGGEIQLTDALLKLAHSEGMFGYVFEGNRYDAGDKLGFVKATINYGLKDSKIKEDLLKYLKNIVKL